MCVAPRGYKSSGLRNFLKKNSKIQCPIDLMDGVGILKFRSAIYATFGDYSWHSTAPRERAGGGVDFFFLNILKDKCLISRAFGCPELSYIIVS